MMNPENLFDRDQDTLVMNSEDAHVKLRSPEPTGRNDERLNYIEQEIEILKSEIKHNLIDLREMVMKWKTVPSHTTEINSNDQVEPKIGNDEIPTQSESFLYVAPKSANLMTDGTEDKVPSNTRDIVEWLIAVKEDGLSPRDFIPYLETYRRYGPSDSESEEFISACITLISNIDPDSNEQGDGSATLSKYGDHLKAFGEILARRACLRVISPEEEPSKNDVVRGNGAIDEEEMNGQSHRHGSPRNGLGHSCGYCGSHYDSLN